MTPVYSLITGPAEEPLTLAEVAAHVRQDSSADDAYLTSLIAVVRRSFEDEFNLYMVTQTVDASFPDFPNCEYIHIPRGPIQSVTSVKYFLSNDSELTFASSNYDFSAQRQRVQLKYTVVWPSATLRPLDPVTVRCVMGFGAAAAVPTPIKHSMLMVIDHLYTHRSDILLDKVAVEAKRMARAADHMMGPYRRWKL